jgi:putative SOS response-associated peptidase YedK
VDEVAAVIRRLQMPLIFPDGIPNLQPRDIAITDSGPIFRIERNGDFEMVIRRWSWPGPGGKRIYNYRADGREFGSGRCLIVADGFYEFTKAADPKQKRKDRWLFTSANADMIGIAGLIRSSPGVGEAFTMLTTDPGPDVAPYHSRQVAVLPSSEWRAWLAYSAPARDLLGPHTAGTLTVRSG